ncbi:MAG: methylated-DNA--[protein]-cysteine S-methyltransferase [Nocardioides sp.]
MWTVIDSPVGHLRIVEHHGAITSVQFAPFGSGDGRPLGDRCDGDGLLGEASRQLVAYFAKDLTAFDLPMAPTGTPWQLSVWAALAGVPYGETASYGEIAHRLGKTSAASRAVGTANGQNPIAIVVGCHRIIGSDGSLTGYAGGLERKRFLLDLEANALF